MATFTWYKGEVPKKLEVFGIAARLSEEKVLSVEKGIDLSKIYKQSMMTMTKSKFEAQKMAMNRLEFFISLLWLISVDTIIGIILFIVYKCY